MSNQITSNGMSYTSMLASTLKEPSMSLISVNDILHQSILKWPPPPQWLILTSWHHPGRCSSTYTGGMISQTAVTQHFTIIKMHASPTIFSFFLLNTSKLELKITFCVKWMQNWWRHTGGSSVDPVRAAYCLNTSLGRGPSMTKISIIPLSENQWVSIWAISVFPFTRSAILEKKFYK